MNPLQSPAPIVAKVRKLLHDLNDALDPITAQSLETLTSTLERKTRQAEATDGAETEDRTILSGRLASAQLQSSLAYVLLDLVWILLRLDGKEVEVHPVTAELDRVRQYLAKVHKMDANIVASRFSTTGSSTPSSSAPAVDGTRASRFIQGALGTTAKSSGKRTVFADDGTVQAVMPAGAKNEVDGKVAEDNATAPNEGDEEEGDEQQDQEGWTKQASKRRRSDKGEKKKSKGRKSTH